jgi:sulfate permease, SulP family
MTKLSRVFRQNLNPAILFPAVIAGLVAGVLALILQLSFAALIFSNDLSRYPGQGIVLALVSGFILALVVPLTSSFAVSVASPQDSPAAVLALLAASLLITLPENTNSGTVFATVIVQQQFTRGGFGGSQNPNLGYLPWLDHGVEWCEN